MYASDNPRFQARALWLRSKIPGKGKHYIQQALNDENEDIRITAIRSARQIDTDIIPIIEQVVNDPSAQVRRTALIALRHQHSPKAPALWAQFAEQYDGKDRWYLEALGISADQQWDTFFAAWLKQTSNQWNSPAGRDIVWRSRTESDLPLLEEIIEDPKIDPEKNLKFFRALDFYPTASKQLVLQSLLKGNHPKQSFINAISLLQMDTADLPSTDGFRQLVKIGRASCRERVCQYV